MPEGAQFTPEKFEELETALKGAVERSCDAAGLDYALREKRISALKALLDTRRPIVDTPLLETEAALSDIASGPCVTHGHALDRSAVAEFSPATISVAQPLSCEASDDVEPAGPHQDTVISRYRDHTSTTGTQRRKGLTWLAVGLLAIGLAGAGGYIYFDDFATSITPASAQQEAPKTVAQAPTQNASAVGAPSNPANPLTSEQRNLLKKRFATIAVIQKTLQAHADRVKRYPATGGSFVTAPRLLKTMQTQGTKLPKLDLKAAQALRYKSDGKSFKLAYLATGDCYQVMKVAPDRVDPKRSFGGDCYSYGRWTPGGADF